MNEQETTNPTLTFDQLQAIDVTQKRLAVLESEVVNATKILKGTKMEADRATKENAYQNELLVTVTAQVETAKVKYSDLTDQYNDATRNLEKLNSEIKEKTTQFTAREMELKDREAKVVSRETKVSDDEQELKKRINAYLVDTDRFDSNVAKLKEVISTF